MRVKVAIHIYIFLCVVYNIYPSNHIDIQRRYTISHLCAAAMAYAILTRRRA